MTLFLVVWLIYRKYVANRLTFLSAAFFSFFVRADNLTILEVDGKTVHPIGRLSFDPAFL